MEQLVKDRHAKFLNRCLQVLPDDFVSLDTSKLTILYFVLSSLDVMDTLDKTKASHKEIIDWIYEMQIKEDTTRVGGWGFRGSTSNGIDHNYDHAHLTMIYSALNCLLILGDDWSRLDRLSIIHGMHQYQMEDGSFCPTVGEMSDMRFVYCAASICYLLKDWSGVNVDKMIVYIRNCMTYEGAFGQCPGNEAHGGSTFCAVATLLLTGRMYDVLDEFYVNRLVRWCVNRQDGGFNGRPNKETDTCYTFWVGATLRILGAHHMIDSEELVKFVFSTQHKVVGGFSKHCYTSPDPLHTYLGLSGLALIQKDIDLGVIPVNPELNITEKAERFWRVLPITTNL